VNTNTAERWLKKLEKGRVLKEGWPKYNVRLDHHGALVVIYRSANPKSIEREKQWPEKMGLVEGKHYTVKMPEEGREGYVYIRREGLERAAWLSVHGSGKQQRVAAEFVKYILKKAEDAGEEVRKKAEEIVKKGKERDSQTLNEFEKKVEVNGREHVVKVISWSAEFDKGRSGKKLLRMKITAGVDNVRSDYTITYGRYRKTNVAIGRAYARSDAPEVRETDAERYSALIKALTGREPAVHRRKDGKIRIECYRGHLEGFMRYVELADVIERWLEEVGR
jgi:sarcosine oxidase delta subunit